MHKSNVVCSSSSAWVYYFVSLGTSQKYKHIYLIRLSFWCHKNFFDPSSGFGYRDSRCYRERGGIMAKRAGSGGEGLALIPAEGYLTPISGPIFGGDIVILTAVR